MRRLAPWVVGGILVVSPWPLGGRLPWVSMLLAAIVIATAVAYATPRLARRVPLGWSPVYWPMLGFLAWTGVQWVAGLSTYPHASSYEWVRMLSYACFFVLCMEIARTRRGVETLMQLQIGVAFAVALFSLVQFFTWNGLLYWVYDPPYGGVRFGPFNNNNYYPAFMIPALALTVGLLWSRARKDLDVWLGTVAVVGALSLLMARSRSGAIAAAAMVLAVWALDFVRRPAEERNWTRALIGAAVVVAVLAVGLVGLGQSEAVFSELETIAQAGQEASLLSRFHLWRTSLTMFLDRPITGFGLATFGWELMPYRTDVTSNFSMHAHNEYLEALVETGLPGLVLVLAFIYLLLREGWTRLSGSRGRWERGVRTGAFAGWCGVLVFAMLDFPSVLPATDYLLGFLGALAIGQLRQPEGRRSRERSSRRRSPRSRQRRRSAEKPTAKAAEPVKTPPESESPPVASPDWHVGRPHPLEDTPSEDEPESETETDGRPGNDDASPDRS